MAAAGGGWERSKGLLLGRLMGEVTRLCPVSPQRRVRAWVHLQPPLP